VDLEVVCSQLGFTGTPPVTHEFQALEKYLKIKIFFKVKAVIIIHCIQGYLQREGSKLNSELQKNI
jgi:hypothetical protein